MSTPGDIRSLYVETLARAQRSVDLAYYPQREDGTPREDWDTMSDQLRGTYLDEVAPFADALAAAGLLPTVVEERVYPCDCECDECAEAALAEGAVRQRQYTTGWREVRS